MPAVPISLAVTAATFAGMSANDYPDGQRVTVTDDGEREYEARGADGARSWVQLHDIFPYLLVRSADDLPAASGGEHLLPADRVVMLSGDVDLGANALRLSAGTVLRGMADATVTSTADGVVRCSGLADNVILREFSIVATGGRCLDLSGPIDQQLNVFFVGLIGVGAGTSAGTVHGFDVQAFKDCYINAPDGLTFAGTANKLFVSQCPFYSITGSAITLDPTFTTTVADIVSSFFKFDSPGVCVTSQDGYSDFYDDTYGGATVGDGLLRGSLIDGTAVPLEGLTPADVEWKMSDNLGIRDSVTAGKASATATETVAIATAGTFVQYDGTMSLSSVSERFVLTGSELEYTGRYPALVEFASTFTLDPAGSVEVAVRATLNGSTLSDSEVVIEQGVGAGASSRAGTVVTLQQIETGDTFGIALANNDDTTDIDVLRCTMTARA